MICGALLEHCSLPIVLTFVSSVYHLFSELSDMARVDLTNGDTPNFIFLTHWAKLRVVVIWQLLAVITLQDPGPE
jgi:hypothetical protein